MNSIEKHFEFVAEILANLPESWVELTTHRLDIYDESQAKTQFLAHLNTQFASGDLSVAALQQLPTAYDYIRLGHQLSSILEWLLAEINELPSEQVITFASNTMPILAIARHNKLTNKKTRVYYDTSSSPLTDLPRLREVYGYHIEIEQISEQSAIPRDNQHTNILVTQSAFDNPLNSHLNVDMTLNIHPSLGSALVIHHPPATEATQVKQWVKEVQHVRRRETIAITPPNALNILHQMVNQKTAQVEICPSAKRNKIYDCIKLNTGSSLTPLIGSSGLSIQYAIMMGLVENALTHHANKAIKIMLPPNCYGGTNDQCRRIADLIPQVEIVDLLVDGGQDLVSSLEIELNNVAAENGVPIILAEIPTNPRVEVPDMNKLAHTLGKRRKTANNENAVEPVFIVDQTFCPNVKLLGEQSPLVKTKLVSFSSGSKFPSGGRCIAGYCAANNVAKDLLSLIEKHLQLSDNQALAHQLNTLAEQMPSMPNRITKAYQNTRQFVDHIQSTLTNAKINFVSDALAEQGFTPSVFSLDLPSTGDTPEVRELNKRQLNKKLIDHMIGAYPQDCKYCVSYGQLKGSYWTIPATSTQGTTKETDKDYIVRVALSPQSNVAKLSTLFTEFCRQTNLI